MRSSSKEGHSGNTDVHEVAVMTTAQRKQALAERRAEAARKERPSRIRMAADAAFGKDLPSADDGGQRPSRIRQVAAALVYRAPAQVHVAGDPGERKQSIRELRAKHAAAKSARS